MLDSVATKARLGRTDGVQRLELSTLEIHRDGVVERPQSFNHTLHGEIRNEDANSSIIIIIVTATLRQDAGDDVV